MVFIAFKSFQDGSTYYRSISNFAQTAQAGVAPCDKLQWIIIGLVEMFVETMIA